MKGLGATAPLVPPTSALGRAVDRRIENVKTE